MAKIPARPYWVRSMIISTTTRARILLSIGVHGFLTLFFLCTLIAIKIGYLRGTDRWFVICWALLAAWWGAYTVWEWLAMLWVDRHRDWPRTDASPEERETDT